MELSALCGLSQSLSACHSLVLAVALSASLVSIDDRFVLRSLDAFSSFSSSYAN